MENGGGGGGVSGGEAPHPLNIPTPRGDGKDLLQVWSALGSTVDPQPTEAKQGQVLGGDGQGPGSTVGQAQVWHHAPIQ